MGFLEKLYSQEYFGIILFVVIAILIIAFIVILLLGTKDRKKRESEQNIKLDSDIKKENEAFKDLRIDESSLDVAKKETPIANNQSDLEEVKPPEASLPNQKEEKINSDLQQLSNEISEELNSLKQKEEFSSDIDHLLNEAKIENENVNTNAKEFDFDVLASSISKELESINVVNENKSPQHETFKEEDFSKKEMPIIEEFDFASKEPEFTEENVKTEVEPNLHAEEKTKVEMPKVFSSVFINRNIPLNKENENKSATIKEEPIKQNDKIEPVKNPKIELPKSKIELPKKNENLSSYHNISGETYNINKDV